MIVFAAMKRGDWKSRLQAEVEAALASDPNLSMTNISKAAGMGPNYLSQMFSKEKTPTVENLMRICDRIGVSVIYILTGIKIGRQEEELIRIWQALSEEEKDTLLRFVRMTSKRPPETEP